MVWDEKCKQGRHGEAAVKSIDMKATAKLDI